MLKIDSVKVLMCAVVFILSGCDSNQTDTVKKINTVEIIDIHPPTTQVLIPGEIITITVTVAYELGSKAATATLALVSTEGLGNKSLGSSFAIVQKGKGELVLKAEVLVPKIKILQVRVPIVPQQRNDVIATATRTYKVAH